MNPPPRHISDPYAQEVPPTPTVSPRVRTAVYFVALGVAVVTFFLTGIWGAFDPETAPLVATVCAALNGATGMLAAGLGVAYRPTRSTEP